MCLPVKLRDSHSYVFEIRVLHNKTDGYLLETAMTDNRSLATTSSALWEHLNTRSAGQGGTKNQDSQYAAGKLKQVEHITPTSLLIDATPKGLGGSDIPLFIGQIAKKEDPGSLNWGLILSPGDKDNQRQPYVGIQLKVHRVENESASYFQSTGSSVTHKVRIKFVANTFNLSMRKVPEHLRKSLLQQNVTPHSEELPPELLQVKFQLLDGHYPCIEGYPWPFHGPGPVADIYYNRKRLAGNLFLRDLMKRHSFSIVIPCYSSIMNGLRTMGNVLYEKGDMIPYPQFRTPNQNNKYKASLDWDMKRFLRTVPECQARVPEPYRQCFNFDRFEDWGISASQAVVQDIYDLMLESEAVRDIQHQAIFVRAYPMANTQEKRESEYWVLINHDLVSPPPHFLSSSRYISE